MTRLLLLVLGGLGAGVAGSVAGLASLISYPALLAAGLPPVTANVTNTVALVFGSIGSVSGSRPELRGQGPRVRRLAGAAALGGVAGGVLLLLTPAESFERIVPWLIGLASIAILVSPRPVALRPAALQAPALRPPSDDDRAALVAGVFCVGIYGGYFGAAAGVLLLALLLHLTAEPLPRSNATKNVLLGIANAVAAFAFVLFGPVSWAAVAPLALGFLAGGRLGPVLVRRAPVRLLRFGIAIAGVGVAASLGVRAYG